MDYAPILDDWCGGPDSSHRLTRRVWWGPKTRYLFASSGSVILGVASEQQPDGIPALDPEGEKRLAGPLGLDIEEGWQPIAIKRLADLYEFDSDKTATLEGLPYDTEVLFELWTVLSGPNGCTVEVVRLDPNDRTRGHALRTTTEGRSAWISALTESEKIHVELTAMEDSEESTEAIERPSPSSQEDVSELELEGLVPLEFPDANTPNTLEPIHRIKPGNGEVLDATAEIRKLVALAWKWKRRELLVANTQRAIAHRLQGHLGETSLVQSLAWEGPLECLV